MDYRYKYNKYKKKYLVLKGAGNDKNKILGTLYGVCVGDALGSRYEFLEAYKAIDKLNEDMKNNKLPLLGGGPFNFQPGQISDDGEMTLSLLHSISTIGHYDQKDIAQKYLEWFNTKPIDYGKTIEKALFTREPSKNSTDMIENSQKLNQTSLSNGVLMRCSPIGIMALQIKKAALKEIVNQECDLTHPNPIVKDAVFIYCLAIKYAIMGMKKDELYNKLLNDITQPRVRIILLDAMQIPEPTYLIDRNNKEIYVPTDDKEFQGYLGVALQNTFYEFLHNDNYYDSMINIIKRGGDTDTNCAIAGGLLGAYYGLNNIPKEWLEMVKTANYERANKYPFLNVNHIEKVYTSI